LAKGISQAITDFIIKGSSLTPFNPFPANVPVVDGDI
jgi:hypothetical protein